MLNKLPLILSAFILLFYACNAEDSVSTPVDEAQHWFTNNVTSENFEVLNYIKDIEWSKSIISSGDKGEIIEVPFTVHSNLKTKVGEQNYTSHHRLLLKKSGNSFTYNHVQILTQKKDFDNADKNFNFYQITDNFDGIVLVVNQNKETVQFSDFKNSLIDELGSTNKMVSDRCVYMGWLYENGDFEALMLVGCFGGGGGAGSDTDNGGYPPHVGGGGSKGSITRPTSAQIAEALQKQIDGTKLDPCTKAVLDKLKNLKQGDIAAMIERFNSGGSVFKINMSTGQVLNNNPNTWAQTTAVSGSLTDVNMVFNQDYINGKDNPNPPTDLSVATTMVHEVVHAYLISILKENNSLGASVIYDFPTVYEAYVQQEITKKSNILPDAHHELIAKKYVNAIASTIQEFHTGQPVTSDFPYQVYLDMAWGGLQNTYVFNKNYPNDPNHKNYKDRERIFARINTEKKGSQYGINSPIGTPCKK